MRRLTAADLEGSLDGTTVTISGLDSPSADEQRALDNADPILHGVFTDPCEESFGRVASRPGTGIAMTCDPATGKVDQARPRTGTPDQVLKSTIGDFVAQLGRDPEEVISSAEVTDGVATVDFTSALPALLAAWQFGLAAADFDLALQATIYSNSDVRGMKLSVNHDCME